MYRYYKFTTMPYQCLTNCVTLSYWPLKNFTSTQNSHYPLLYHWDLATFNHRQHPIDLSFSGTISTSHLSIINATSVHHYQQAVSSTAEHQSFHSAATSTRPSHLLGEEAATHLPLYFGKSGHTIIPSTGRGLTARPHLQPPPFVTDLIWIFCII